MSTGVDKECVCENMDLGVSGFFFLCARAHGPDPQDALLISSVQVVFLWCVPPAVIELQFHPPTASLYLMT